MQGVVVGMSESVDPPAGAAPLPSQAPSVIIVKEEVGMKEKIITNVTIVTQGEPCEMDDEALREWYESHIAALFDPRYGTPKITVEVQRIEEE